MVPRDIRELDVLAVEASVGVVSRVAPGQWGVPTPCAGWTLGHLVAHMTAQHHGFAAAAAGNGADLSAWRMRALGNDPAAAYAKAADAVTGAFAESNVLARPFFLPEISPSQTIPGAQAIGFHLVDYVVHGWDVARSLGVAYRLEPDLLEAALEISSAVPDTAERLKPGAAFRPGKPVPAGASPLDRIVAMLGRWPSWPHE
jgi:uncharacterized protein (TIGR03086 family)